MTYISAKVSPGLLTQQFLSAIQRMTELFRDNNNNEKLYEIERHILLNFKIWSRPNVDVRKGRKIRLNNE